MRGRGFRISHQAIANIIERQGEGAAPQRPWPAGWIDKTDEMVQAGGIITIIGAARPKEAKATR
jgi:hypothetical protein